MKIIWAPQALRDLREIYLYLLKDSPGAVRALHERIRSRVLQLADAPQIGRPGRVPGTRELVIPGSRYIVPYRVAGDTLQILRVYHTARVWPGAFD
ncbi:type II toxin-antitoxin system RelE/ParE family toxin [Methylococcus mesophilus]|uniref:type II toxin-antitoxin system RelE/ParE family toxin n=1 Tax=Methylococcus mesophilus TaxID=2993564 RepID=UPI00224B718F|nr:type II toxin-antitoxin system RelE/ParE family toxin [Methylococcus mesophilus]UZR27132.1 type II toxin-antitoxin system RelE/ParE family toxin [Methylococcus mesophilus]